MRPWHILAGGVAALLSPLPLAAQAPPVHPDSGRQAIALHGLVSTSFSYNLNRPPSRTNQLRVFDYDDADFRLDLVQLVAQRPVARPGDIGFRVDFTVGATSRITASSGLFRDTTGTAQDLDLPQAFVSFVAPVGSGLRLDAGKFVTALGYEVIEGYEGWNDNATHSFLFGYAIPFTHTGIKASYAVSPEVSTMLMVVNGWDNVRDNNGAKTVGFQIGLTPSNRLAILVNGISGPEQNNDDRHLRDVLDVAATWRSGDHLSLGFNGDWGRESAAASGGQTAVWRGAAGYLRLASERPFALSLRAEWFDDRDGVRTGTAQTLSEITLTPEARLGKDCLVRSDLRLDRSDHAVFEGSGGPRHTQPTVAVNVLYRF
jgi:Putative beta-barrel porin-2, OmpL-like. bbp2